MPDDHSESKSTRRSVLKVLAVGVSGAAMGAGGARWAFPPERSAGDTWRFLTAAEAKTVVAIAEQIIPADSTPGATDACVVNFIDKQLDGHYQRHQQAYRDGLASLQATCKAAHGKRFEDLAWGTQIEILQALQAGKVSAELWKKGAARDFFGLVRDHTMQGFYGSPRHGGNRNYISYRMLGLEYPRVIGQNRYNATPEDPARE